MVQSRLRSARSDLYGNWPRRFQFPGLTPYRGDSIDVLEAFERGDREDGKRLQPTEVVEIIFDVVGLAHPRTVTGCAAHQNAHAPLTLGAQVYTPCPLRLQRAEGEQQGVREIVDFTRRDFAEDGWHREWRGYAYYLADVGNKTFNEYTQQDLYELRLHVGRPSRFLARA